MMNVKPDTIYALATPDARGGIAIIRISGPDAQAALAEVFRPRKGGALPPRMLCYGHVYDGDTLVDEAMAVYLPAPKTYTCEDVCEIHTHGSQSVVGIVLEALARTSCRPAAPGEFTRRAYENGRIDLAEAEAVMDIIAAQSRNAAKTSAAQLSGSLSARILDISTNLINAIASLEAALDYPEDEWEQEATAQGIDGMRRAKEQIDALLLSYTAGNIMMHGVRCAIIGKPNAGKSSFLNAAAGFERALVDEAPGTTRDVVDHNIQVDGTAFCLIDTAGLRAGASDVESRGIDMGLKRLANANVCLLVLDASQPLPDDLDYIAEQVGDIPCIGVMNKTDLPAAFTQESLQAAAPFLSHICTCCAVQNEGVYDVLHEAVRICGGSSTEDVTLSNARHYDTLRTASTLLEQTLASIAHGTFADIAVIDAKQALSKIGEITGETASDAVVDAIFAQFCLGK